MTIKTIKPPNAMISSVDPISETSSTGGVDVGCWKNAAAEKSPSMSGGVREDNDRLKRVRIRLTPKMIAGRASFFITLRQVYHAPIPTEFQPLYCTYICFCSIMPASLTGLSDAQKDRVVVHELTFVFNGHSPQSWKMMGMIPGLVQALFPD